MKSFYLSKEDFNPEHTLLCGQIFSYEFKNGHYIVYSKDKKAEIFEQKDFFEIQCDDLDYFKRFFDIETDYSTIKKKLFKHKILKEPIKFGYGIRILKNDKFEMLISFITLYSFQ